MSEKDNILLSEISSQIKKSGFDLVGIYLFGSRAKDTFNKDSDYDIAIILNKNIDWRLKDKLQAIVYDIMLENDIIIDSHIFTKNEIESPITPLRESIKLDGVYFAG
ncbi:MAG TPA: nucleotidyltransferase domain-containing protein [Ignavibacteriaceae bacterium]|nr:nucleotidyltransferase domain-containing protein [Ignavibacteriaceae bacterium]